MVSEGIGKCYKYLYDYLIKLISIRLVLVGPYAYNIIMATLRSRCGHYIFVTVDSYYLFFPHLFSAVAYWMSAILPHMVWP